MNNRRLHFIASMWAFGLLMCFPAVASAAVFVGREGTATTSSDISSDLFAAGEGVIVDHQIRDDAFLFGRQIYVRNRVGGDVFAAGENVTVEGAVGDDIAAAGSLLRLGPTEVDDIMAAGNVVELLPGVEASDVYLAGQKVVISGHVTGTARVAGEHVVISSTAIIDGDLITYGATNNTPNIENGAQILGETRHVVEEAHVSEPRSLVGSFVRSLLTWFVVATLLAWLLPGFGGAVVRNSLEKTGASLGVGLIWTLVILPLVIGLFITVIGIPVAIFVLLVSIAALILAQGVAVLVTGSWIMRYVFKRENELSWQHALLGVFAYKLVGLIPFVGWLVVFVVVLISLGSLGISSWNMLRQRS